MRRRCMAAASSCIGNFVYSDGSYSSVFNVGKTCIGICFYDDNNGDRRMLSLKFPNTGNPTYPGSACWGRNGYYVGSTSLSDGLYNTSYIVERFGYTRPHYNTPSEYPAANICWNFSGGGKQWYLPSLNELIEINKHKDKIEQSLKIANGDSLNYHGLKYASSTESDASAIHCLNPYDGSRLVYDKQDFTYPVRPCAKF